MLSSILLLFFLLFGVESYSFEEILKLKCEHLPYRTHFKDMTCSISTSRTVDCTQFLIYDGKLRSRFEGEDGKICIVSWENICGRDAATEEFCYKIITNRKNFWDAAEDCTNQGYSLFSPHSDCQLQFFWEIVRVYSEQEFWTGVGTYRNQWIFHDRSTADFFRLNPNYDFDQVKDLALTFTSKSWSHAYLGYTRVAPAADLNAYICARKGSNPYVTLPDPESFPKETTTSTTTTSTITTTSTTTTTTSTTTTPTTTTTTTQKYCPPGGEWTDWDETPRYCDDFCGSAGKVTRTRRCLSNAWGCPCTGPSSYGSYCEPRVCLYPRQSCYTGIKKVIVSGVPQEYVFQCGPPPGNPPDTPKPPGYCPSHGLGIWSQWGYWGACSATCGLCGTQMRNRACISPPNCPCVGQSIDTRSCPTSRCGTSCCRGYQVHTYDGWKICKETPQPSCQGTWTEWGGSSYVASCGPTTYLDQRWCIPPGCQCPGPYARPSQRKAGSLQCSPGTVPVPHPLLGP